MEITFPEVVNRWRQRKQALGPVMERMRKVQAAYNGEIVIPVPEADRSENAYIANLLQQGLDQTSMRIASTLPDVRFLPEKRSVEKWETLARQRRDATLGWWTQNQMHLKMRRRARWLIGYGCAPVMVRPNEKWDMPMWQVRNPLTSFPAPGMDPDDITPTDCIFSYARSLAWLKESFPNDTARLSKGPNPSPDDMYDVLEYVDHEWHLLGVVGKPREEWDQGEQGTAPALELIRVENRAGVCPVVAPGRITLDRPSGQFDGMVSVFQMQAKLMALEVMAVERGIFPDTYLISRPNEVAGFIDGPFDGRTGKVNIVRGGDIKDVSTNPGFQTNPVIDRLERAQRLTAGIPSDLTGEAGTNVRTGRRSEVLLSAVLDFPVQEAQDLFSAALEHENKIAIAIDKAYFGHNKSYYINLNGRRTVGEYDPRETFTSDVHYVRYPSTGADANSLVVGLGQRVGTGLMSKQTARELDPMVEEPERERDLTTAEALEAALLASIQQQASGGAIGPADVARIMQLVLENKEELPGAVLRVQEEAQARQATPAPEGSPETMPGLAPEGIGAEQPVEEGAGAPPQLAQLLGMLRGGTTQTIVK